MNLSDAQVTATLIVSDIKAAKDFYSEKLGLKQVADFAEDMGIMFEAGRGTRLYAYQSNLPTPQNTAASFKVDEVLTTVNELKAKGVQFESYDMESIKTDENNIAHWGNLQFAWFKDPSGNIIAVGSE